MSQHGADTHAWDPLAHLRVTTTAMGAAARLVDTVAHRWAGGRWLSTGGGGYDAYRVVPRAWALTWLAGAHREAPAATPAAWRSRWESEAAAFGTPGMPAGFEDPPNAGQPILDAQAAAEAASMEVLARVRRVVLPRLLREAEDRGWWSADLVVALGLGHAAGRCTPTIRAHRCARPSASLAVAPRTVSPFDPVDSHAMLAAALRAGTRVVGAVAGSTLVGVAVADAAGELLALGVAPSFRRDGLGAALLRSLVDGRPAGSGMAAQVGVAERDWVEPLDVETRRDVARRLLTGAGFELRAVSPDVSRDDPWAIAGRLAPV